MTIALWGLAFLVGVALIVWGAESFAEHLSAASVRLGISGFALALLLVGAEPEELATSVSASLQGSSGIALGDVIGANVAICLIALGVGAWIAPLPFRAAVMRYALLGLPLGAVAEWFAWDGVVSRLEGAMLACLYAAYVGCIWAIERRPPALGEVGELQAAQASGTPRVGRDLLMVLAGVATMAAGAFLLVDALQRITGMEATQTRLGLTLVGFATGFELVVLAWSAARRGISEAVVAGVVGSFAYNATMTLGAGALARPLAVTDAQALHWPLAAMIGALAFVALLAVRGGRLERRDGVLLLATYPAFVALVWLP